MSPTGEDFDVVASVEGVLVQDWITIRGQDRSVAVTQGSSSWVDLGDFEDLVFFLDVREVSTATGVPQMRYETSPTKQDGVFQALLPSFPVAVGQRVDRVFTATSAVPPARFLRWKLTNGGVPWDLTFRLWVGAYAWRRS